MLELTREQITHEFADIRLRVPTKDANRITEAIEKFLALAGMPVREINERGEELYTIEEVFPDMHPGSAIKGARHRENLTQAGLAQKIGVKLHHISEMENGRRPIGKALNTGYKVFL